MKSAYEKALEKFGEEVGEIHEYTDEQKKQLADIDAEYDAKIAEARMSGERRLVELDPNSEDYKNISEGLKTELASLEEERENKKRDLRRSFDAENSQNADG